LLGQGKKQGKLYGAVCNIENILQTDTRTVLCLSRGDLKAGTESETIPAQDKALQTKYPTTKILQT
jgi:hypothetical protein